MTLRWVMVPLIPECIIQMDSSYSELIFLLPSFGDVYLIDFFERGERPFSYTAFFSLGPMRVVLMLIFL
jgi:hypothetical protein